MVSIFIIQETFTKDLISVAIGFIKNDKILLAGLCFSFHEQLSNCCRSRFIHQTLFYRCICFKLGVFCLGNKRAAQLRILPDSIINTNQRWFAFSNNHFYHLVQIEVLCRRDMFGWKGL